MTVETIKKEMATMSSAELSMIIGYGMRQIKKVNSETATFSVGDKVIVVQKTKRREGVILKMNPKKAVVEMPWQGRIASVSVPYSMLEAA
jgi:putative ribosome biogenesis GTPase RsgA